MSAKEGVIFYHLNAIPSKPIPNQPCKQCKHFKKTKSLSWCCGVNCVDWNNFEKVEKKVL